MKIALIGATGNIGTEITKEALRRGHLVTAVARKPENVPHLEGLTAVQGDLKNGSEIASLLSGHDVIGSAVKFESFSPRDLIAAVKNSGTPRLIVVGGAASLLLPDGTRLFDSPHFPDAYRGEASAGIACLEELKGSELDWTFISPSAEIAPGERTTKFRLGKDDLLTDAEGKSHISQADFAIAFIDEMENSHHSKQRFTVGY